MKLYKKDSKGKIRFWHVGVDNDYVVQTSGLVGSKNTPIPTRSQCVGKNIGRANETTPHEQALIEAASKIKDKLTKGYFKTIKEAKNEVVILPMLAKDAKPMLKKIKYPCYVQPKLDGMRSLGNGNGMISRTGKPVDTMGHIVESLKELVVIDLLDGELYAHGLSFQENISLIKKYREGETEKIHYHVYDMVLPVPFKDRYALLKAIVEDLPYIDLVEVHEINNETELKSMHSLFLEQGYEGTIIRWGDTEYEVNKRSSSLLKYKDFIDITAEIIDVVPMEKRPEQGMAYCRLEDGGLFTANFKMPFSVREEILINKKDYIGHTAEIRFFEYTDAGLPRFPVCVGFRLDK